MSTLYGVSDHASLARELCVGNDERSAGIKRLNYVDSSV